MAQRIRSNVSAYVHDNYATSTGGATKTLPAQCTTIVLENMDTSISVLVSFDAGVTWKTVKAGSALSIDCDNILNYQVKSASGTPNVECLYGKEL